MPEGPSILILKEKVQQFKGDKVIAATCNNGTLDTDILTDQTIVDFKLGQAFSHLLPKVHYPHPHDDVWYLPHQ